MVAIRRRARLSLFRVIRLRLRRGLGVGLWPVRVAVKPRIGLPGGEGVVVGQGFRGVLMRPERRFLFADVVALTAGPLVGPADGGLTRCR